MNLFNTIRLRIVFKFHLSTTEDASLLIRPATLSRFWDFAAAYKSADLLTYLLRVTKGT